MLIERASITIAQDDIAQDDIAQDVAKLINKCGDIYFLPIARVKVYDDNDIRIIKICNHVIFCRALTLF
jgi:hypothetical protein